MITVRRENKEIVCGVYSIRNVVNDKRYIGSSKDIYGRWTTHIRQLENQKHENDHLQKSWNKYGKDNFEFTILETCGEDERFDIEQKWYDFYHAYDYNFGYNISKIARHPNSKFTIEDIKNGKACISYDQFIKILDLLSHTNMPLTEVASIIGVPKGIIGSIYNKQIYKNDTENIIFQPRPRYISNKLTIDEVKEIIDKLKDGIHPIDIAEDYCVKPRSIFDIYHHITWKEYTEEINFPPLEKHECNPRNCVVQYDLHGNKINKYKNNTMAQKETGISCSAISQVCLGKIKTAGGFIWRYGDDLFDKYDTTVSESYIPYRNKPVQVDQYKDGKLINTYQSISDAQKQTGINNISNVLNGKMKHTGGFEWKRHIE